MATEFADSRLGCGGCRFEGLPRTQDMENGPVKLLQKILFPTDFGTASQHTGLVVANLAKRLNSELILLHVVPGFAEDLPIPMERAKEASRRRLSQLKADLEKEGVAVSGEIVTNGVPFEEIIRCAFEQDANVIVIGAVGASEGAEERLGTTAEHIIRKATRPVWVVKNDSAAVVSKILCAVDYSAASARALKNAIHLARAFGAELSVLTVIRPLARFSVYGLTEAERKQVMAQQENDFHTFLKDFDFHDVNWSKLTREGKPHREIVACASERAVDLLVMGSVGRTGVARILLGSVAARVTRELPCSVVTVKTEDVIRPAFEATLLDIKSSFAEGKRLLAKGSAQEAKRQFRQCVTIDPMFAPGWEGLAEANKRLGNEYESSESNARAQLIRRELWERQAELEIRLRRGRGRD